MEAWTTWVPIVISAATFGLYVLGAMRNLVRDRRKDLTEDLERCEDRLRDCQEECRELRRENARQASQIVRLLARPNGSAE